MIFQFETVPCSEALNDTLLVSVTLKIKATVNSLAVNSVSTVIKLF